MSRLPGQNEGVIMERIRQLASEPDTLSQIVDQTNERLQTELAKLAEQRNTLERELVLYGKPPELSHTTQGAARSETSNWLPG